jgi:hypothetical protein
MKPYDARNDQLPASADEPRVNRSARYLSRIFNVICIHPAKNVF